MLITLVLECVNIVLLPLGIYFMYRGIEIQHPLYAILFFNLISSLASSIVNSAAFAFLSTEKFSQLSNLVNVLSLFLHDSSWLTSTVIR